MFFFICDVGFSVWCHYLWRHQYWKLPCFEVLNSNSGHASEGKNKKKIAGIEKIINGRTTTIRILSAEQNLLTIFLFQLLNNHNSLVLTLLSTCYIINDWCCTITSFLFTAMYFSLHPQMRNLWWLACKSNKIWIEDVWNYTIKCKQKDEGVKCRLPFEKQGRMHWSHEKPIKSDSWYLTMVVEQ